MNKAPNGWISVEADSLTYEKTCGVCQCTFETMNADDMVCLDCFRTPEGRMLQTWWDGE